MSAASFEEIFLITGEVQFKDVDLIATVLEMAKLIVPKDELQQQLATWDHSGDYVMCGSDMETLFTTFSSVEANVGPASPIEDTVVDSSVDTKVSCAMDFAELEAALKDKTFDNMPSLPQGGKQLALDSFNNLLLKSVQDFAVELDQDDILKIRAEMITRDLPGIIKETAEAWVDKGIYVTHTQVAATTSCSIWRSCRRRMRKNFERLGLVCQKKDSKMLQ